MSWYWWLYFAIGFVCLGGTVDPKDPWHERLVMGLIALFAWPVAFLVGLGAEIRRRSDP